MSDAERALTLDPQLAEAWANCGGAWFVEGDATRAMADFNEAIKLAPRLAVAYGNRGTAWLMQGKLAEAEADFARCHALGGKPKPEAAALLQETKQRLAVAQR